jgi:hypothetical protein
MLKGLKPLLVQLEAFLKIVASASHPPKKHR